MSEENLSAISSLMVPFSLMMTGSAMSSVCLARMRGSTDRYFCILVLYGVVPTIKSNSDGQLLHILDALPHANDLVMVDDRHTAGRYVTPLLVEALSGGDMGGVQDEVAVGHEDGFGGQVAEDILD